MVKHNMQLLIIEFVVMFIGLPVFVYFEFVKIPKILALLVVTAYCLSILIRQKALRNVDSTTSIKIYLKKILLRFIPVGIIITLIVVITSPQTLFFFPRQRPGIWLLVMFFYPILSALPQELIYRTFFFHRYKLIFKSKLTMILMSTVTFGFLHIIYDNLPAVILSMAGGYLFSKTYNETRSLLLVSFEHALYGAYIFTVGLGHFFYEGF